MVDKLERKREIKFRAWDKIDEKLWNVVSIDFIKGEVTLLNEYTKESYIREMDEVELMQYTGLKNKNGEKIYEGDIVKVGIEPFVQVFEVKLDNIEIKTHNLGNIIINTFILYDRKTGYKEPLVLERINSHNKGRIVYEVIGNIYDNLELLK